MHLSIPFSIAGLLMYDFCIPFTPSFEGCAALGSPRRPAHSIRSLHVYPEPRRACPEPREVRRVFMRLPVPLPALSFQLHPTVKSCNHFVLITIQNAGGWAYPLSYRHPSFSLSVNCRLSPWVDSSPFLLLSAVRCRLLAYLSSLECAVPRFGVLSPLECADPKMPCCNPFRMRSYKKRWGGRVACPASTGQPRFWA